MKKFKLNILKAVGLASLLFFTNQAAAATAKIAVAANFTKTVEEIGAEFEKQTGHKLMFSFGPTGKLYAQIKNGAPFDVFFGANEKAPKAAIKDGLGVEDSYFVYAQGVLVLYSKNLPVDTQAEKILQEGKFRHLSIANPVAAPYGTQSVIYLKNAGFHDKLENKIVQGESIGHAFQFVVTENAELGFVAKSQVVAKNSPVYQQGYIWEVPQSQYNPINQGVVLLEKSKDNKAATEFLEFMKTPYAIKVIEKYGYNLPK